MTKNIADICPGCGIPLVAGAIVDALEEASRFQSVYGFSQEATLENCDAIYVGDLVVNDELECPRCGTNCFVEGTTPQTILAGSNDELLLHELYSRIRHARNPAQAAFVDAWEISSFVASDGFETLFEQDRSIEEFAQALAAIGVPQLVPTFRKVAAMVPEGLRKKGREVALREHLDRNFENLKELFNEYIDISGAFLLPALGHYVREHRDDFADVLS